MNSKLKFPVKITDRFPINIVPVPICPHIQKGSDCICVECVCHEGSCVCSSEELSQEEEEENDLHKKGGPFYKMTQKETTPTLVFLENFTKMDFCDFSKERILKTISKNHWTEEANEICFQLIEEAYQYGIKTNFNIKQSLAVMELFYTMFKYFMTFPLLKKRDFYKYFKALLLLYCVQDAPDSLRIFNPIEAFAIAYTFSNFFDRNYDLLRAVLFSDWKLSVNITNL